jgi:glycine dehydrogenase
MLQNAILNANYMATRSNTLFYNVGEKGRAAHEMILDCRSLKKKESKFLI